ncbi:GMC family oxidoreductase [Hyphomicrobium sp.]|uniref:GMC family oxidoreductase n=1 Tax=Hyphomicrobium sp. TaxID=82 RepID=UPI0025BC93E1|nr:GMC family oxidoreductase [Hyphomicrobium sp.]MCC7251286.1 GMC family oxidoreductase [Hyphomicrobium sp.]
MRTGDRERYDVVVVGSGFGALFFLDRFIRARPKARIVVLEWGAANSHEWQINNQKNSTIAPADAHVQVPDQKPWNYTIGLGGGTNCWFGQSPRLHPSDFALLTKYGVGRDWPVTYDDLEPYYLEAETIMSISGAEEMARILPRSGPFPQPPHRVTAIDRMMMRAQPDRHVPIATARARVATQDRSRCCATARCNLCPVDAKFTALNGFKHVLSHPGITWRFGVRAVAIEHSAATATGVRCAKDGREEVVDGDLIVLGANAIHSPAILLQSDLGAPKAGLGVTEQLGFEVEVLLDGLDNFDGSTITTGLNFSLYDGEFRREHGAALLFFENRWSHGLRKDYGRWRQTLPIIIAVENLPLDSYSVALNGEQQPVVDHGAFSDYAVRGLQAALDKIEQVLQPLPVERIVLRGERPTESHIQCSLPMGDDAEYSTVDRAQVHHKIRNLIVVGSAVFPTCPPANPSLTVAALSLRAADMLTRSA